MIDAEVVAWALGGYLGCFIVGFAAGILHKGIIRIAESIT